VQESRPNTPFPGRFQPWVAALFSAAILSCAALAGIAPPAEASSVEIPDAQALVQKVVARAKAVSEDAALPTVTYTNVSLYQTFAPSGDVKRTKEKTYRVTLAQGMTQNELIAIDGLPLAPGDQAALSEKERKWRDAYAAGRDGTAPRRMDQVINEKLFARFDLRVSGQTTLRGHRCWVIELGPRASPPPEERLMDRVFNRLTGRAWVDLATHEIVRVEAHTEGPLRLWGGILGALESFQIHLDREDAGRGVWYNRHLDVTVRGRRLFTPLWMRANEVAGPVTFKP
jgi:hypothetical protein